ncbi:hypothetical protein ANRL4_00735 [Anaerolineae bacterium]|nr:hypothetical protein ANRL4_00735 [Anaerolineae bacterium]
MYATYDHSLGGIAKVYLAWGESHILDMQFSFTTLLYTPYQARPNQPLPNPLLKERELFLPAGIPLPWERGRRRGRSSQLSLERPPCDLSFPSS